MKKLVVSMICLIFAANLLNACSMSSEVKESGETAEILDSASKVNNSEEEEAVKKNQALLKKELVYISDNNPIPDQIWEYFYDEEGRKILVTNTCLSEENGKDYVRVEDLSFEYNKDGSYTERVEYFLSDEKHITSYDSKGREIYRIDDMTFDGEHIHTEYSSSYTDEDEFTEVCFSRLVGSESSSRCVTKVNEYGDTVSWTWYNYDSESENHDILFQYLYDDDIRFNDCGVELSEITDYTYDYEYDENGRKVTEKLSDNLIRYYEYDDEGLLIREREECNNRVDLTEYTYNEDGLLIRELEDRGNRSEDEGKYKIEYEYY